MLALVRRRWQQGAMAQPRLLIRQKLTAGAEIDLDASQARHVGAALRLGIADELRVFNADDGEWRAAVSASTRRGVSVRVG
jgi:16S rRNA (uracil1498-N3)-methyltransferase